MTVSVVWKLLELFISETVYNITQQNVAVCARAQTFSVTDGGKWRERFLCVIYRVKGKENEDHIRQCLAQLERWLCLLSQPV